MRLTAKTATLRIATHQTDQADTLILQGSLCGPAVDELVTTWQNISSNRAGHECVIDIVDLTCVDVRGENELMKIMREGARFVVRGVYSKSLLESLSERCRQEA